MPRPTASCAVAWADPILERNRCAASRFVGREVRGPGRQVGARRRDRQAELGRLEEAEEDLRKAIRVSEELGERQLASWTWRALAEVSERRGDKAEAERRRSSGCGVRDEAEAKGPR